VSPGSGFFSTAVRSFALCAFTTLSFTSPAAAQTFTTLFNFTGHDGGNSESPLILQNDVLYGTTMAGGKGHYGGAGVVFSFNPKTNEETVVHAFRPTREGLSSFGVTWSDGVLYGTTWGGDGVGNGALFKLDPATGHLKTLFQFNNEKETGWTPNIAPIVDGDTIYGTTTNGGSYYSGVIYKFDIKAGTQTILHNFNYYGGNLPDGLVLHNGALYGTTQFGGGTGCGPAKGCGVLYKLDLATRAYTIIHSFGGVPDGIGPVGIMFHDGYIYGVTQGGGRRDKGLLYRIDPKTGEEKRLFDFQGGPQPPWPNSALTYHDGALYGTAGARSGEIGDCERNGTGCGAAYKYNLATNTLTTLYRFTGKKDGGIPLSGLLYNKGTFYGTTELRGGRGCNDKQYHLHYGCGTIFKITP
jgi:uncharacterized repeat protein (TIGR03803 family)